MFKYYHKIAIYHLNDSDEPKTALLFVSQVKSKQTTFHKIRKNYQSFFLNSYFPQLTIKIHTAKITDF